MSGATPAQRVTPDRRRLVLVTSDFPFGHNSDFLGDEIHALAAEFDDVLVVPLTGRGSMSRLPPNVRTDGSLVGSNGRLRRLLALRRPGCWATLARETAWSVRHGGMRAVPEAVLAVGKYALVLRWACSRRAPSLAYTYWLGPATAALRRAWPDTPLVSRAHRGELFWEDHDPPVIAMQQTAVASADAVASVSEVGVGYLCSKYPGRRNRIVLRRLGSTGVGGTSPRSSDGTDRVLSISSLRGVKRPELLARAVCILAGRRERIEWHHFGDGPLAGEVEAVLRECAPPNLGWHLHGQTAHGDLVERVESGPWDVFVNVSASEGVPVSIMEAKSAGIPLVATRAGGTAELVDADMDQLVDVDTDATGVADALERALDAPDRATERRSRWSARWSARTNDTEFARWLGEMAQAGAPAVPGTCTAGAPAGTGTTEQGDGS